MTTTKTIEEKTFMCWRCKKSFPDDKNIRYGTWVNGYGTEEVRICASCHDEVTHS